MQHNNSFINPFSSVTPININTRKVFYNCQLKEFTVDEWTCNGPYNDIDEANKCIDSEYTHKVISLIMVGNGSISDKIHITRKLINYTFPDVTFKKPLVLSDKN